MRITGRYCCRIITSVSRHYRKTRVNVIAKKHYAACTKFNQRDLIDAN